MINYKEYFITIFKIIGIIDDVLKSVPIMENDSIFELGCGTGAVLKRIIETHRDGSCTSKLRLKVNCRLMKVNCRKKFGLPTVG